ncbi:MICOS complex subunit MIC27 [Protopterus annectens]|uniref:MICOS complex subunit MIC27 n=1 Tax=Protopterus annectens TaxID=7888 RepID=UPI001CFBCD7A|nr:MICOS complex subunit MIC27 [Protopterus annectens]
MAALCARLAAVSAGLTVGTHTVCAAAEDAKGPQLRPQQLSVYSPPASSTTFVEEQPGHVQKGFSAIRQTFHPFIEWYKGICNAAKNGVLNTVSFGQDSYSFIKNPPEGFLPRITVIAVSGFAGVVLARKGSRFKKVIYPLGLTTLGVSLCYPAQAVVVAKVTGQNVYAASHWTYGSIRSLWEKSGASKTTSTAPLATKVFSFKI